MNIFLVISYIILIIVVLTFDLSAYFLYIASFLIGLFVTIYFTKEEFCTPKRKKYRFNEKFLNWVLNAPNLLNNEKFGGLYCYTLNKYKSKCISFSKLQNLMQKGLKRYKEFGFVISTLDNNHFIEIFIEKNNLASIEIVEHQFAYVKKVKRERIIYEIKSFSNEILNNPENYGYNIQGDDY